MKLPNRQTCFKLSQSNERLHNNRMSQHISTVFQINEKCREKIVKTSESRTVHRRVYLITHYPLLYFSWK